MASEYPEHDKLTKVSDQSQIVGEFLEFIAAEQGLQLCRFHMFGSPALDGIEIDQIDFLDDGLWLPNNKNIQDILSGYFGIDLVALEAEKRLMLDRLRHDAVIPARPERELPTEESPVAGNPNAGR